MGTDRRGTPQSTQRQNCYSDRSAHSYLLKQCSFGLLQHTRQVQSPQPTGTEESVPKAVNVAYRVWSSKIMSLMLSCLPMMSAEPSAVHAMPRMRGPGGSCINLRYGVEPSGSTIQMDASVFVG